LHYAEAVLSELFRVSSVAPITPPHRATKDTTLNGYFIPKVCIYGGVLSETCSLANQLHLYHEGDRDGTGVLNIGFYNYVTWLSAPEDFIELCRCENFKTCFAVVLWKCIEIAPAEIEVVHRTLLCQHIFS
jgi:hypothetical protein